MMMRKLPRPDQFEPRIALTYPNGVWTSDQFWRQANAMAEDIITRMVQENHPLPLAAKNGLIDRRFAADTVLMNIVASINAECIPAGNA